MASYQFRPVPECQIMRGELSSSGKEFFLSACLTYNSVSVDIPLAFPNVFLSPNIKMLLSHRYNMGDTLLCYLMLNAYLLKIMSSCQVWNKVIGLLVQVIFGIKLYSEFLKIFLTFRQKIGNVIDLKVSQVRKFWYKMNQSGESGLSCPAVESGPDSEPDYWVLPIFVFFIISGVFGNILVCLAISTNR